MTEPIPMDNQSEDCKAEPIYSADTAAAAEANMRRKDKRKAMKKDKRKQKRKELAEKERQEEEKRLNDPEEQRRIAIEEEKEKERLERERREFEERERLFLEDLARRNALEEEEALKRAEEEEFFKQNQVGHENEVNEEDEWEYIEEGPPEIIWQGNEIIVKKNKVRVKKKDILKHLDKEDTHRPTSNPLPPQSEAFNEHKNASTVSAQQLLDNVAQQTPNFGTEQDKANCPFHLKTGSCRFGSRCNRVHFYPDKSCTLLIKHMYNGPGLAWEQDEGLEHTDEEIERGYEEFYEDVHTEFLKFGELVNFKVSRNSSVHLRGNVYVHFKSLDSAVLAYNSINGRYFAGKQMTCEFINVTRWKVAICGEFMKSKLQTCSRGRMCNFIHCFRNPGGDYEWADWDNPAPRYWVEKMVALFGYEDEFKRSESKEMESSRRNSRKHRDFSYEEERSYHRRDKLYESDESDRDRARSKTPRVKSDFRDRKRSRHEEEVSKNLSNDKDKRIYLINERRERDEEYTSLEDDHWDGKSRTDNRDKKSTNGKYDKKNRNSRREHSSEVEKHGKRKSCVGQYEYEDGEDSHDSKYRLKENVDKSDRVVTERHRKHRKKI